MVRIKESRTVGFIVISGVYIVALVVGVAVFRAMGGYDDIIRLLVADCAATVAVWLFSLAFRNASVYDPYWSVAPVVTLTLAAFRYGHFGIPALLLLAGVWLWGVRLTMNWAHTFHNLSVQDWRYDKYQRMSGRLWPLVNLFGIHMMPTLIVFLCIVPGLRVLQAGGNANILTWAAFAVMASAVALQYISDRQAHRFRAANPGGVCDRGLWKYSRHPNYMGEILMWWGVYFLMLSVTPGHWPAFAGALANTCLFVFISIPMMEKRQLANKPRYAAYVRSAGMILPRIRRSR